MACVVAVVAEEQLPSVESEDHPDETGSGQFGPRGTEP